MVVFFEPPEKPPARGTRQQKLHLGIFLTRSTMTRGSIVAILLIIIIIIIIIILFI